MDDYIFAFIVRFLQHAAWPAVVLIVFFSLKSPIVALIGRIRSAKYKDLELAFAEGVREVREDLEDLSLAPDATTINVTGEAPAVVIDESPRHAKFTRLMRLAKESPRGAVLEAWLEVEEASRDLLRARGSSDPRSTSGPLSLLRQLEAHGLITREHARAYQGLRSLRNEVVHQVDVDLPFDSVANYVITALALAEQMRSQIGD